MDMGADAVDALAAAAHSSCASSMFLGVTYHANVALHYVAGELSAVQLRQLLQECLEHENAGSGSSSEAAAAAETAHNADATLAAGGASVPGSSTSTSTSTISASQEDAVPAPPAPAGSASRSEVEASLKGALLLAQALHPLSDVAAVRRLVRQLGQELTRRMQQAQALPGSRQAVELLNKLMFGPPSTATPASDAPYSTPAAPASLPAAASSSGTTAPAACSSAAACSAAAAGDGLRFPWWRRSDELDGPDLSGLAVPQGSTAGMGLQGNSSSYYATSNSCLDSVLASRAGLPISLALLHAAVGEAAGLTVQLVGMPGHVITRALIRAQGSQGSAGAGLNPSSRGVAAGGLDGASGGSGGQAQQADGVAAGSGSWMYVDVFNGGAELSDDDLRTLALRHNFPVDAMQELLQPMSAGATLRRMTLNLINSIRMGYAAHVGRLDMQKPPLHQLQLRSISVALLALHLAAAFGGSIPARDAFDMGVQLSQLIGLGHAVGPPGGVLLMRELAEVLPPPLMGWRVKIEAGIQGEVEAKERQQQQRQQQARLHSRHPSVRQRVGDTISLSGSRPGAILGWRTTPRTPLRRQQPTPSACWFSGDGETVEGHYGAPASQAGGSSSAEHGQQPHTDENVNYKLLFEDGTIRDVEQAAAADLRTPGQLLQHQEQQQLLYSAREEACAAECKRQLQHLQRCWFEQDFVAGLRVQERGSSHATQQQQMTGWPDRHLSHGQHYEAWVAPEDPEQDGWFWLNASLRVEFPEG
ncbi:Transglutaminase-like superfamily-domain-containing protein [Scenedesmus sp. NREL 46B-D3]|nr:Transglutaminase-like superfamily-domain-containing protein [Scenedesmus sp. NREL 46B-D3]